MKELKIVPEGIRVLMDHYTKEYIGHAIFICIGAPILLVFLEVPLGDLGLGLAAVLVVAVMAVSTYFALRRTRERLEHQRFQYDGHSLTLQREGAPDLTIEFALLSNLETRKYGYWLTGASQERRMLLPYGTEDFEAIEAVLKTYWTTEKQNAFRWPVFLSQLMGFVPTICLFIYVWTNDPAVKHAVLLALVLLMSYWLYRHLRTPEASVVSKVIYIIVWVYFLSHAVTAATGIPDLLQLVLHAF